MIQKKYGIKIQNIQNNKNNLSPFSKRNRCDNEKTNTNVLFVYPSSYKYNTEEEIKNKCNEPHGKKNL